MGLRLLLQGGWELVPTQEPLEQKNADHSIEGDTGMLLPWALFSQGAAGQLSGGLGSGRRPCFPGKRRAVRPAL